MIDDQILLWVIMVILVDYYDNKMIPQALVFAFILIEIVALIPNFSTTTNYLILYTLALVYSLAHIWMSMAVSNIEDDV